MGESDDAVAKYLDSGKDGMTVATGFMLVVVCAVIIFTLLVLSNKWNLGCRWFGYSFHGCNTSAPTSAPTK